MGNFHAAEVVEIIRLSEEVERPSRGSPWQHRHGLVTDGMEDSCATVGEFGGWEVGLVVHGCWESSAIEK